MIMYTEEVRVIEGDTVLLLSLKPSDYSELILEEVLLTDDSDHTVEAALIPCKQLTTHYHRLQFQSRNLTLTYQTYQFGEQPYDTPIYLLPGSNVTYYFRVWANSSQMPPPEFVVFDNYNDYLAFLAGENDESDAIFRRKLYIGSETPQTTKITFNAGKHGYYYITGHAEAGISYQFNVTDAVFYLNVSDYVNTKTMCNFTVKNSCSLETSQFLSESSISELCLLAHSYKPPSSDPPSTHIVITAKTNYSARILFCHSLTLCTSFGIFLMLVILLTYIVK